MFRTELTNRAIQQFVLEGLPPDEVTFVTEGEDCVEIEWYVGKKFFMICLDESKIYYIASSMSSGFYEGYNGAFDLTASNIKKTADWLKN